MPDVNDMDLVREYARTKSEVAFTELVQRHINLVYSVARRLTGTDGDAQDVTQAVFVILAHKAAGLHEHTVLTGWLYEATRFTAARLLRTNARRHAREQEAYMESTLNEADPTVVWKQLTPHLETAMARLAERDRAVLVLRYYENKSGSETAALLGIREEAAHKRAMRALEKLRKIFAQRGVALTITAIAGAVSENSVQAAPVSLVKVVMAAAMAKGPAGTVSTLTLVKGTLKIMAWTNAKSAIAVGVAALLIGGVATVTLSGHRVIARTTPETEKIKGQIFGPGELVDAGNTTPEAAWESRYWARSVGDYNAVLAATDSRAVKAAKEWMGDKATFPARSKAQFDSFKEFQIVARKDLADGQVELEYRFLTQDSLMTKIVTLVKIKGAWLCAQTTDYDASWDVGSQPEPQS